MQRSDCESPRLAEEEPRGGGWEKQAEVQYDLRWMEEHTVKAPQGNMMKQSLFPGYSALLMKGQASFAVPFFLTPLWSAPDEGTGLLCGTDTAGSGALLKEG